uniref:Uncharacterized protein n=1 Tax=Aegilops tauschii subsp. strangulata TaxID=200361 RepID=A0A453CGY1_AEGTS
MKSETAIRHLCEARNRNRYRLVNPRDDTTNSVSQEFMFGGV